MVFDEFGAEQIMRRLGFLQALRRLPEGVGQIELCRVFHVVELPTIGAVGSILCSMP